VRAVSAAASGVRHLAEVGLQALIIVGIIAALLLALAPLFGPAEDLAGVDAANARGHGHASISVADGTFGGTTVATVEAGGDVLAKAECYQGDSLVYFEIFPPGPDNTVTFTLGPTPLWQGGDATCTAQAGNWAKNGRWRAVAKTTFEVTD
jgi:hypothetical protein